MAELELSPEAARLMDARKAAIEELRQIDNKMRGIGDHDVQRLASCRMLLASLNERMLNPGNHPVSPSELEQADAMVERVLADAGKRETTINLRLFGGPGGSELLAERRPGETVREVFGRACEQDAKITPVEKPPTANDAQAAFKTASDPIPAKPKPAPVERPYHETAQKDSRPNAPISGGTGFANNGSAVWSGSGNRSGLPNPFRSDGN